MDNKSLGSVFSLTDEKIKSGIELLQKNQMKTQRAKDICNSLAINLINCHSKSIATAKTMIDCNCSKEDIEMARVEKNNLDKLSIPLKKNYSYF